MKYILRKKEGFFGFSLFFVNFFALQERRIEGESSRGERLSFYLRNRFISNPSVRDLAGGLNVLSEPAVLGSAPEDVGTSILDVMRSGASSSLIAFSLTMPERGSSVLVRGGVS